MYRQILIPTDGSELSLSAVDQGVAFAKATGAGVHFFTVTAPIRVYGVTGEQLVGGYDDYTRAAREEGGRRLAAAEARATAAGVPCSSSMVESDHAWEAIINAADDAGCDLIAMASHGRRGLSGLVLGSETLKVLTHSTIPVLVYREPKPR
ncbi:MULTISPECIES: universal stress protein [unclassified Luteimonas]|uniref:universal stress protein n=1 Tax=unclassified Luteimonas TaxID=2629088 RepID=UPI0018F0EB04|nr:MULTISPECIES: universal stress protein [unclassified Luteimonas]MBJ6980194.1 universal stress protein [Luteimonas sp. MC1895]MBJ6985327.1 universal stress protein [Luteimonas sp. MC1750]QQO05411.1 universal stress protein [Luteimonas sp. MC1750]